MEETEKTLNIFFAKEEERLMRELARRQKQLLVVQQRVQEPCPRSLFSTAWRLWVKLPRLIPEEARLFNEVEEIEGDIDELQLARGELEKGERRRAVAILKAIIKRTPPIFFCGFSESGVLELQNPLFWELNYLQRELDS